jgi:putative membrane protein
MAFGFVVVKFSIFIKQISLVLGRQLIVHEHGYSSAIGILLVGAGAASALLAYLRYRHVKRQLDSNTFDSSSSLIVTVTALLLLIGAALVTYLIQST